MPLSARRARSCAHDPLEARKESPGKLNKEPMFMYLILFGSIAMSVCGQILLKTGIGSLAPFSPAHASKFLGQAISSPWVWLGLVVYAASATLWLVVLSRFPLSVAYPVLSIGYVAVIFLSYLIFGEAMSTSKVIAAVLIIAGVALLGRS